MNDSVLRLRPWGQLEPTYPLPVLRAQCSIGTEGQLKLQDASGLMSREHALLIPLADPADGWKLRDFNSKNGLRCDGERQASFRLRPGLAIEIGGVRLIAESKQLDRVLHVLRRLLGWAPAKQDQVDSALQSLRSWAAQRGDLLVVGDGPLHAIVRQLHDLVIGPRSIFVVDATQADPDEVIRAASRGTLCLPLHRQGAASAIIERVHALDYTVRPQLVVCAEVQSMAMSIKRILDRPSVIEIPSPSSRGDEMEAIIASVANDKVALLDVPESGLTMHDMERLTEIEYDDFDDLEETVTRMIAIRVFGVSAAAERLGIDHSSLSGWARYSKRRLL